MSEIRENIFKVISAIIDLNERNGSTEEMILEHLCSTDQKKIRLAMMNGRDLGFFKANDGKWELSDASQNDKKKKKKEEEDIGAYFENEIRVQKIINIGYVRLFVELAKTQHDLKENMKVLEGGKKKKNSKAKSKPKKKSGRMCGDEDGNGNGNGESCSHCGQEHDPSCLEMFEVMGVNECQLKDLPKDPKLNTRLFYQWDVSCPSFEDKFYEEQQKIDSDQSDPEDNELEKMEEDLNFEDDDDDDDDDCQETANILIENFYEPLPKKRKFRELESVGVSSCDSISSSIFKSKSDIAMSSESDSDV